MSGVRVVYHYRARAGQRERAIAEWEARAQACRVEPGCVHYGLFQNVSDPDDLAMLEWWDSRAAYDAHWRIERTRPEPAPGATEDVTVEFYEQQSYEMTPDGSWVTR